MRADFRDRLIDLGNRSFANNLALALASGVGWVIIITVVLFGVNVRDLPIDTYLESMRQYLRSKVWQSSLGQLFYSSQHIMNMPLFVKPATDTKKCSGQVASPSVDTSAVDKA